MGRTFVGWLEGKVAVVSVYGPGRRASAPTVTLDRWVDRPISAR
jgi:hypothetical protein